ncbi:MgtC/SapB family protein [Phenylobacterium sp.]|uniref:MgtC/SapB family protein n=1 Tax=Phenylobacterium sp. TaxID=1871053 RepID=UPI0025E269A2|nr:MgtC/SapB family protein [Phenylobacterium sp.]
MVDTELLVKLGVALGIGLLIGTERERRKLAKPDPTAAGIRTFTVAALAGALSALLGGVLMLVAATTVIGALVALSYWRTRKDGDPGLTTEIALVVTTFIGALAMSQPQLAATVGVGLAILLAGRSRLHHFVSDVLTEEELEAALLLGAATLVVLPLLPDRGVGPFLAVNPRTVWKLVILVMAIGAVGHVAVRALGPRFGLPIAGLASGFVSSTATIGAMGSRAASAPETLGASVAGAVLSTLATVLQMAAVLAATSLPTLQALTPSLLAAGVAAAAYGIVFTIIGFRHTAAESADPGKAISVVAALTFGAILAVVMLASAALRIWFGDLGSVAAAAVAGLADTHAAAISVAALVASGAMTPDSAVLPILAGLTANTASKVVFATTAGGRTFAMRVVPGLLLVAAAAWAGALPALTG